MDSAMGFFVSELTLYVLTVLLERYPFRFRVEIPLIIKR